MHPSGRQLTLQTMHTPFPTTCTPSARLSLTKPSPLPSWPQLLPPFPPNSLSSVMTPNLATPRTMQHRQVVFLVTIVGLRSFSSLTDVSEVPVKQTPSLLVKLEQTDTFLASSESQSCVNDEESARNTTEAEEGMNPFSPPRRTLP